MSAAAPAAPPCGAAGSPAPGRAGRAMASLGVVVGFWWIATGLIVASQRSEATRVAAFAAATLLALLGAWLVRSRRHDTSAAGARWSLLGGALLWSWSATTFYAGWIVGPGTVPATGTAPSLEMAVAAIAATLHSEVVALGMVALAWGLSGGGTNRVGAQVLVALWGAHQLAKLNVFFGVANPARRFLPEHLAFLEAFFGPGQNSPLLLVSTVGLLAAGLHLLRRARAPGEPGRRHGALMIGSLLLLAALEHAFLALPVDLPLWDGFLQLRGY